MFKKGEEQWDGKSRKMEKEKKNEGRMKAMYKKKLQTNTNS